MAGVHSWQLCQGSAILLTLILLCAVAGVEVVGAVATDEGWALLDFKGSISDPRGALTTWKAEDAFACEWRGITCDKHLRITGINLRSSGLSGTISPELRRLRKLRTLDLSENDFSGPIPSPLSEFRKLWKLRLDHNNLSGSIPRELGRLSNLRIFDLSYNSLSGPIPECVFRECRGLRFLSFAQNRLSGSLPRNLRNCVKLTGADFSSNAFAGNISVDFSMIRNLKYLSLQRNRFAGPIPKVIGNLSALSCVNMGYNLLSGGLPHELKRLGGLRELIVNDNQLSGEVPAGIATLPSLQHLDLSSNRFSGHVTLNGSCCMSLRALNLAGNDFEGSIPLALSSCSELVLLNLASNRFSGTLLPDIGRLAALKFLDASGNHLVGEIPANITGLTALSVLVLRNNEIQGQIPPEIGTLKALEILDLSSMRLDGGIPSGLGSCTALQKLNLSGNKLSGSIPTDLGRLSLLRELNLGNNAFSGSIPAGLVKFGFTTFLENPGLCGAPLTNPCSEIMPQGAAPAESMPQFPPPAAPNIDVQADGHADHHGKHKKNHWVAIAILGALVFALVFIALASAHVFRAVHRKRREIVPVDLEEEKHGRSSQITEPVQRLVDFLERAYDDKGFGADPLGKESTLIGVGSIGTVYKAAISDGLTVAVKKPHAWELGLGDGEIEAEMKSLLKVRHPNLVMLQAYYLSSTTMMLIIWEYIPNGTLSTRLHDGQAEFAAMTLTWLQRYTIALGIARGLAHLHCNHRPPILHLNLTSTNILLDESCEAKISDFGMRRFLPIENRYYISSGEYPDNLCYIAPELSDDSPGGEFEKCDVYSFGVVLLELVTGQKPWEVDNGATVLLRDFVESKSEQRRIWECIDSRLSAYDDYEVENVMKVALLCTSEEPSRRPTMAEAVRILEENL